MASTSTTDRYSALGRLAEQQAGCIAVWQASPVGLDPERLQKRAQREGWRRPHRSVYILPGVPMSTHTRLWAALLSIADLSVAGRTRKVPDASGRLMKGFIGDVAAVTGWSAAWEYGHRGLKLGTPQFLTSHSTVSRRSGVQLIRSRRGIEGMWTWHNGLPLATPQRTLWDCAHLLRREPRGVSSVADLAVFFDRTRRMSVDELLLLVLEPATFGLPLDPPRPLRAAANRLRPGFSHSGTEARARAIASTVCDRLGLTLHPRPYPVRLEGRIVAEIDLAIPALRFGAEVDDPHHNAPSVQAHDRRRDGVLTRQLAWTMHRYPTSRLDRADGWQWFEQAFTRNLREHVQHQAAA